MRRPSFRSPLAVIAGVIGVVVLVALSQWFQPADGPGRPGEKRSTGHQPSQPALQPVVAGNDLARSVTTPDTACNEAAMPDQAASDDPEQTMEEYWRGIGEIARRLSLSPDPDQRHAAVLLEQDPARRIELLNAAMMTGRGDPFLAWTAARVCARVHEVVACPLLEWEAQLLALDGQNSEAWIVAATNRWRSGDSGAALRAIRQAGAAPETRFYWPETVALLERAMAVSEEPFAYRAVNAFGISFMNMHDYVATTKMCRAQSPASSDWAYACLEYGELLERQGGTLAETAFALVFQRIALEALGEEERLATMNARRDRARGERSSEAQMDVAKRMSEAIQEPKFFYRYLELLPQLGETAAAESVAKEWNAWRSERAGGDCGPQMEAPRTP